MLDDEYSFGHIHKEYGINYDRLKVLWAKVSIKKASLNFKRAKILKTVR